MDSADFEMLLIFNPFAKTNEHFKGLMLMLKKTNVNLLKSSTITRQYLLILKDKIHYQNGQDVIILKVKWYLE